MNNKWGKLDEVEGGRRRRDNFLVCSTDFFCQHITLGHFDNKEPAKVYDRNGYFLRTQPFTSLMADLLQDDIGLLSQMKRVTKYKSSFMT